jgi:hypothetical protein
MSLKILFELFVDGYTPADIVKELDLTEADARDIAIKVNDWLEELQREGNYRDSYKRF